jgi:hypothetical protein
VKSKAAPGRSRRTVRHPLPLPAGSVEPPRLPKRKHPAPDAFLTGDEIYAKCQEKGHCPMVAGQIIAIITLIQDRQWTIAKTAEHSRVSRSYLTEILQVKKRPSTDTINNLAITFGFDFNSFNNFASICLSAEVSL